MNVLRRVSTILMLLLMSCTIQAQDNLPDSFPVFRLETTHDVEPGILYLANFRGRGTDGAGVGHFIMAIDQAGNVVFQKRIPGTRAFNFNKIDDDLYYYYQVESPGIGGGGYAISGAYYLVDSSGEVIREVRAQGDMTNTPPHEFIMLENGKIIIFSNDVRVMDMSEYGGHKEALVVGAIIQEIDPQNNVVFEWQSWDHIAVTETNLSLTAQPPDDAIAYVHGNGLAIDLDGNLILSARNMDELIKIDRATGSIIWHMGGERAVHNDFTFVDDPLNGFSAQHSPRILENGNLLLFDNGNLRENPRSRAVEYEINEDEMTARLVWSYDPGRFTPTMGSVQRMSNGNTLVNWGSFSGDLANITEVSPAGEAVLRFWLPPDQFVYRAYRYVTIE